MSLPIFLAISGAGLIVLVAMIVALARRVATLADGLLDLQKEVRPVLEAIRRDSDRMQEHLARLQERDEAPREARTRSG